MERSSLGVKMAKQHDVNVWGKPHTVTVSQRSKSVWIAVGEYNGQHIETKGVSEASALKRWREAAESGAVERTL